jgi:predicted transcriptional regulator
MVRQIEIDEDTDRILGELAQAHEGDLSKVLADFLDETEEIHNSALSAQVERAERGFREGRFTTWDKVKQRNCL